MSHLRRAVLVLVACALLAAPTPEAVAQQPPRSQPRELWQQFPLEEKRSSSRAPAELESTPEVSAPTTRGTPGEQTGESGRTVRTAVIVLAMALVLMLTTGVLAYAAHGELAFWAWGRRRRIAHSFLDILERPPVEAPPQRETERLERQESNAKPMVRNPGRPRRHAKREAAVTVASITSEVDVLRKKLDVGTAPKKTESPGRDRIERLREKFDMYFASAKTPGTQDDKVDSLKAKLDVTRPPAKSESVPDDERQRLKKKLAMRPADSGSASHDEIQTLKEKLTADDAARKKKLSGVGATAKREKNVRPALETQLVDHGPRPTSERTVDVHADTTSPKVAVSNRSAKDRVRVPVAVEALVATLRETRGKLVARATPVAPRPVSAATLRSTVAELVREYGSTVAMIGLVLIMLALLLLNIAVLLDFGIAS
jgi:hypothetical protein